MTKPNIDVDTLVSVLAGSDGDFLLAAERLSKKSGLAFGDVNRYNEYDIKEAVAGLDQETSDRLSARLRNLLVLRVYQILHFMSIELVTNMSDLKPSDLAKTFTSLTSSFATLTQQATKLQFDFNSELEELAKEFPDVPIEKMREDLDELQTKLKAKAKA